MHQVMLRSAIRDRYLAVRRKQHKGACLPSGVTTEADWKPSTRCPRAWAEREVWAAPYKETTAATAATHATKLLAIAQSVAHEPRRKMCILVHGDYAVYVLEKLFDRLGVTYLRLCGAMDGALPYRSR